MNGWSEAAAESAVRVLVWQWPEQYEKFYGKSKWDIILYFVISLHHICFCLGERHHFAVTENEKKRRHKRS